MKSFLAALALVSLFLAGIGSEPSVQPVFADNGMFSQNVGPQRFSAKKPLPFDVMRLEAQVSFVKIEEPTKSDFAGPSAILDARLFFPANYGKLLRSECAQKFPFQIVLLFPFHEFS